MVLWNFVNLIPAEPIIAFIFSFHFIVLVGASLTLNVLTSRGLNILFSLILFVFFCVYLNFLPFFVFENGVVFFEFKTSVSEWYNIPLTFSYRLDGISFFFIILVLGIGFTTNIYNLHYFKHEGQEDVFCIFLNWFIFGMLILVSAGNFCTLLLGWELIGLSSFLLINFWSEKKSTLKASFKAFVFNRISDFFLFSGCILIWYQTGETNMHLLSLNYSLGLITTTSTLHIGMICLFCCASIKSAQLIGHLWLPDSMEAPVPASALIHSATLVSAGVYLLLRFDWLLQITEFYPIVGFVGALTAGYGGILAATQTDVKRLLAYSTISHCGFLFVCLSLQNFILTFLYLFLHGIFKALTFFCVGSFIRAAQTQDMRQMGLMNRLLPFDTLMLILAVTNLAGMPFTFGAFYKHIFFLILCQSSYSVFTIGCCYIGLLSGVIYSLKLIYYVGFDINKWLHCPPQLRLQQTNVSYRFVGFSTIAFFISTVTLFCLGWFFYLFFFTWIYEWSITVEISSFVIENSITYWIFLEQFYHKHFLLFYSLYFLVFFIFIIFEWRQSLLWKQRIWLFLFTFLTVIFYFLFQFLGVLKYKVLL